MRTFNQRNNESNLENECGCDHSTALAHFEEVKDNKFVPNCICGHLPGNHMWDADIFYDLKKYKGCHPCMQCSCGCYFCK